MTATQLAVEITTGCLRLNMIDQDRLMQTLWTERPPMTAKQKAELARQISSVAYKPFMANASRTQGGGIHRVRPRASVMQRQSYRTEQENRPTLAQWLGIKRHVEQHFYDTSWTLPSTSF